MTKKYTEEDIVFMPGSFDELEFETQEELDEFVAEIMQAILEDANSSDEDQGEFLTVDFDPDFDIDEEIVFEPDTRKLQ